MTIETPRQRLTHANALIAAISRHGRRFFHDTRSGRIARFEIDLAGRLWLRDEYTNRRVYVAYRGHWRHFSNGGTLRRLIECIAAFIRSGRPVPASVFGPWPTWICDGDLWGYGKPAMDALRAEIADSPCLARRREAQS
ncbi:hypothetical protein [Ancylobacter sp. SL191]|uniref:hypothetical protein n=1 Tax=Ancylobacter sp. SL191 TaxID=2995166 RepID=UPI00226E7B8B|nr:hypothetical protein [Ancylobacter sp. SL191]WAC26378.1 hypothetical protein OU996_15335 [Ancylobacter sp. SL191]